MDHESKRSSGLPEKTATVCPYCQAKLDPDYYFCLSCATPYQSISKVIPQPYVRRLTDGELIRRKAPRVALLFWTYFCVIVGVGIVNLLIFDDISIQFQVLFGSVAMTVTTLIFTALYWQTLKSQLVRFGFFHWEAWFGLLVLLPAGLLLNYMWHFVWAPDFYEDGLKSIELNMAAMVLFICVLPGILEEIAFRGLLQQWLQVAIRPLHAIAITSVLFAVLHLSIYSMPYLALLGVVLGWMKYRTGSLYPSMLAHFLHNWIVVMFFWR